MSVGQITVQETEKNLMEDNETIYIDVRTAVEFARGHVPGAINIPAFEMNLGSMVPALEKFKLAVAESFPKQKKLLIGCQKGGRSQAACEYLQALGYENLNNVVGGFSAWCEAGLPVEK